VADVASDLYLLVANYVCFSSDSFKSTDSCPGEEGRETIFGEKKRTHFIWGLYSIRYISNAAVEADKLVTHLFIHFKYSFYFSFESLLFL